MAHDIIPYALICAFGAIAMSGLVLQYLKASGTTRTLTVMQWNVLARPFTMHNREPPKCVQGHLNSDAIETVTQTAERYSLAAADILAHAPDAVLLQELESDFFVETVNPLAPALLAQFDVHATYAAGPGTAVLLRKTGGFKWMGTTLNIGASNETGGTSKSATATLVSIESGAECWLVSVHFTPIKYVPEAVWHHLGLIADALRAPVTITSLGGATSSAMGSSSHSATSSAPRRVLIGGDFNAEPQEMEQLQRASFLGGYSRVATLGATGLSADFASPEAIDHVLISPGLRVLGSMLEKQPSSPYARCEHGPAPVVGASDHVWHLVQVSID